MANKFTMKETNVENKIEYVIVTKSGLTNTLKSRVKAYEELDRMKRLGYTEVVLKKVTTNVETEYLERG